MRLAIGCVNSQEDEPAGAVLEIKERRQRHEVQFEINHDKSMEVVP